MTTNDAIMVTGATGTLGREVLERARRTGRPVRALTRRAEVPDDSGVAWYTGDLTTGTGLDEALTGVRTVIHCASDIRHFKNDVPGFRHLLEAGARAGVEHVVNISIVGVDEIPYPYYRVKLEGERLLADSGIGWTNLRATQFPALLDLAFGVLSKLPVVLVPSGTDCQPVDPGEVADRLVELALGEPAGRVSDFAGPAVHPAAGLAKDWLRAVGKRRAVLPVHVPGRIGAAWRAGHLTAPDHATGRLTWEQYLTERVAP
ncbi:MULTISPECIES: SDR family oxidoreductase [unclassified Streptomyces]|uniref:SDR family oxidoreductase n=1 Tax=unclassified Streptomyces TaxID=2593676 RepID=UPI00225548D7|nr:MULTISPECIES: NAD(P)H-binding protein [unclassified Streptomyces]MCX4527060.1 NAD(P)H-binding protein [Streptomyces sp. NBC_01551]MCX4542380.1 NAD(P)H-binding protein [Streptomyces sp. NBC_01565]